MKIKIPSEDRIFNVESRGIGPLNPSVDHRLPHQRWPLKLHNDKIIKNTDKKKIRENLGLSEPQFAICGRLTASIPY